MKMWWTHVVKDYFSFTRKERRAIFLMIFLAVTFYLFSRYYPVSKKEFDKQGFQKELTQLNITIDTSDQVYANHAPRPVHHIANHTDNPPSTAKDFFDFDPNTLDAKGWKRLGVRDRTIHTIQNFLAKGYRFKQPEDIRRIYGLSTNEADQLVPYVRIAEKAPVTKPAPDHFATPANNAPTESSRARIVDINGADTTEFISLPGIGSRLALRIVNFREKLGGFHSVNQVAETYGIPDSTFQLIKARLQCSHPSVVKMNINTATAVELKRHPYISWNIANAIVNYRKQHGNYVSVEDLHKIEIITEELFKKLAPYFTV